MLTGLSSCKKWLDVKPQTQIESDVNFGDEQGFKDALSGVYLNMTSPNLYGKELSFGFVEVLGKNYTQFSSLHGYFEDAKYNYGFAATKSRIDNIWNGSYTTIANINNLIDNLDKADQGMFSKPNYNVIRGEAYGLRAFNHFDLLRLFAPSPAASGLSALAIPYRLKFESGPVVQSTVGEVLTKIIADLQIASDMLRTSDPIVLGSTVPATTTGYLRDRQYKFNYYAVRALMARVYLYAGDKVNALICAREVINSAKFPATIAGQINSNKIMSTEVIFNINMNNLSVLYDANYSTSITTGMALSDAEWRTVYETATVGSNDYRFSVFSETVGAYRFTTKFKPAGNTVAPNRLPLMRVSEMYYIAAECLAASDGPAAVGYLNTIRLTRNLTVSLSTSLSESEIQNEVFKEYRKDFITEGQLFFYYKRLNKSTIEFASIVANNTIYVLPKPDAEIEYGAVR